MDVSTYFLDLLIEQFLDGKIDENTFKARLLDEGIDEPAVSFVVNSWKMIRDAGALSVETI
jgi:hypothetical protein